MCNYILPSACLLGGGGGDLQIPLQTLQTDVALHSALAVVSKQINKIFVVLKLKAEL